MRTAATALKRIIACNCSSRFKPHFIIEQQHCVYTEASWLKVAALIFCTELPFPAKLRPAALWWGPLQPLAALNQTPPRAALIKSSFLLGLADPRSPLFYLTSEWRFLNPVCGMRFFCFWVNSRRQMTRAQTRGRQPSNRTRISCAARLSTSFSFLPLSLRKASSRRRPATLAEVLSWLSTFIMAIYILVFLTECPVTKKRPFNSTMCKYSQSR